jgi:hypothetical protein
VPRASPASGVDPLLASGRRCDARS